MLRTLLVIFLALAMNPEALAEAPADVLDRTSESRFTFESPDPIDRIAALQNLLDEGEATPETAERVRVLATSDPDPRVRREAISTLAGVDPNREHLRAALQQALADPNPGVLAEAATRIVTLDPVPQDTAMRLLELIQRNDVPLNDARAIAEALRQAGKKTKEHSEVISTTLLRLLIELPYDRRLLAFTALGAWSGAGGKEARDLAIRRLLQHVEISDSTQASAVRALEDLGFDIAAHFKRTLQDVTPGNIKEDMLVRGLAYVQTSENRQGAIHILLNLLRRPEVHTLDVILSTLGTLGAKRAAIPELATIALTETVGPLDHRRAWNTLESLASTAGEGAAQEIFKALRVQAMLESGDSACEIVCSLAERQVEWTRDGGAADYIKQMEFRATELPWTAALEGLRLAFLLRASRVCPGLQSMPRQILESISQSLDGCAEMSAGTAWMESIMSVLDVDPDLESGALPRELRWNGEHIYGVIYSLDAMRELQTAARTDAERNMLAGLVNTLEAWISLQLPHAAGSKLTGASGSAFNTYAFASSLAHLEGYFHIAAWDTLASIVDSSRSPVALPYNPIRPVQGWSYGPGVSSPRGSAGRAVPANLALFRLAGQIDDGPARAKRRANLIQALQNWKTHMYSLQFHALEMHATHLGEDALAPYYYYSTVPYVGQAVQDLAADPDLTDAEAAILADVRANATQGLLAMVTFDGTFVPQGGPGFSQGLYRSSPAYVNPLAGMALLDLATECGPGSPGI